MMYSYFLYTHQRVIFWLVSSFLLIQGVKAADTTIYSMRTFTYKNADTVELKLDVFTPVQVVRPCPALILFHGGSWVTGDKSQMYYQCKYFAQQGFVAVTANYRLLGRDTGRKDLCIMDAKSAIRWIKQHAGELQIDTANIILGGGSAGGHLATMAVMNPSINDPGDENDLPITAKAELLFNPAYSLTDNSFTEPFRFAGKAFPPVIMFFGSKDKWMSPADSLQTQLCKEKVRCEIWIAEGETHGFFNKDAWNLVVCLKAQEFLVTCGIINKKNSKPPPLKLTCKACSKGTQPCS